VTHHQSDHTPANRGHLHDFSIEEFKQACEQYRHLEQERSRQVVFYFSVVAGLSAAVGFLIKDGPSPKSPEMFVSIAAITIFLQIIDTFVVAAVRRLGDARGQHEKVMDHIRFTVDPNSFALQTWELYRKNRSRWWSVQGTAEMTLHLFAVMFAFGSVFFLSVYTVSLNWHHTWFITWAPFLWLAFHVGVAWKLEFKK